MAAVPPPGRRGHWAPGLVAAEAGSARSPLPRGPRGGAGAADWGAALQCGAGAALPQEEGVGAGDSLQ